MTFFDPHAAAAAAAGPEGTTVDVQVISPDGPAFEPIDASEEPAPGQILFAESGPVVLGSFVFQNLEVPATLPWGGKQQISTHKLTGGRRVLDAMGRDDMPLTWSGIFINDVGAVRGRQLDEMRISGAPQLLCWGEHLYTVVIRDLSISDKSKQSDYHITCEVLRDENDPPDDADPDVTDQTADDAAALGDMNFTGLSSDLGSAVDTLTQGVGAAVQTVTDGVASVAGSIGQALGGSSLGSPFAAITSVVDGLPNVASMLGVTQAISTGVGSAMGGLRSSIAGAGVLTGGSPVVIGLLAQATNVQGLIGTGVYASGAVLDRVAASVGGASPFSGAVASVGGLADMVASGTASSAQGTFLAAQGIIGRMMGNLRAELP